MRHNYDWILFLTSPMAFVRLKPMTLCLQSNSCSLHLGKQEHIMNYCKKVRKIVTLFVNIIICQFIFQTMKQRN